MNLVWSTEARKDLRAIHAFIARDSECYAAQMVRWIVESAEAVATAPKRGHRVPEYPELVLREGNEPPYRIVYRIAGTSVEIVTLVHFKRRLGRLS